MRHPLLGDEQHGQHHHGDVVVPGPPAQRLVIGQAALTLGILEGALDPKRSPCIWARRSSLVSGGALERLYLIFFGAPTSRRTTRCQHRAAASAPSHTQTRRCAMSTRNGPRVLSRRVQRVQSCAPKPATSFSTVMPSTAACCWLGERPRVDFGGGTCSPGGSVQTRWSQCTSATKVSPISSSARRKAGSLP